MMTQTIKRWHRKVIKLGLTLLFSTLATHLISQDSLSISGKWEIIAVHSGVYYNYKNDSSYIDHQLLDSLKGKTDSTAVIEVLSSFVRMYSDYCFIFDDQGAYKEIRNGKERLSGTYKMDSRSNTIFVSYGNAENKRQRQFKYKFEMPGLILVGDNIMGNPLKLILEKQD